MRGKIPKVSVIISVYNGAKYLEECLESVLHQTLGNIEIICVDDASTDATPQILERFKGCLTILTNAKNCMAGESRNRGLRIAKGEYIIFLDADDVFEANMLEAAYDKAKLCNADVCIFKEDFFSEDTISGNGWSYDETRMKKLGEMAYFSPDELPDVIFNLWNGWAWDKLFRREYILKAGIEFPDIQTSEDGFFVHAAIASADKISMIDEVLVHHRTGNRNSLSYTRDRSWESCIIYLRKLKKYLEERDLLSIYERSYVNWSADFLYWNYRTLGNKSRMAFAEAAGQFFTNELHAGQYEKSFFYDAFLWWFTERLTKCETEKIPLTEEEHFQMQYRLNHGKLDALHEFFMERQWEIALWGAGIRGQAFAGEYAENWAIYFFR